jgi:hypothetical protein
MLTRFLSAYLFGISPFDPITFVVASELPFVLLVAMILVGYAEDLASRAS